VKTCLDSFRQQRPKQTAWLKDPSRKNHNKRETSSFGERGTPTTAPRPDCPKEAEAAETLLQKQTHTLKNLKAIIIFIFTC